MKFLNVLILGFILSINARAYHSHHSHSHHSHYHPHIGHNHIHSNNIKENEENYSHHSHSHPHIGHNHIHSRENVENEDLSDTKKIVLIITFVLCLVLIFSPVEKVSINYPPFSGRKPKKIY